MKTLFTSSHDAPSTQRFCVFSHFDADNKVERYVFHYLGELKRLGYETVLISTSRHLPNEDIEQLRSLCHTACLRENVGYDFGSYKAGINLIRNADIHPASLLLANDSVFGPFRPLADVWNPAVLETHDFYGMTDSFDHGYHVQSYFLAFGKRLLESQDFTDFWNSVEHGDPRQRDFKSSIILNYEVGGTKHFLLKGYKVGVQFPYESILAQRVQGLAGRLRSLKTAEHYDDELDVRDLHLNLNATHRYWDTLLDMGFPFIKRELLTKNPTFTDIGAWPRRVADLGHFDATMIAESLTGLGFIQSLYQIQPADVVAKLKTPVDVMACELNSVFHADAVRLGLPLKAHFMFDDAYYLDCNPDVKLVVQEGGLPDGLTHFKAHGLSEGRVHRFNRVA